MLVLIALLLWFLSGILSFIFWWTQDFDFTLKEVPISLIVGLAGPTSFLLGFTLHSKSTKILIERRKQ